MVEVISLREENTSIQIEKCIYHLPHPGHSFILLLLYAAEVKLPWGRGQRKNKLRLRQLSQEGWMHKNTRLRGRQLRLPCFQHIQWMRNTIIIGLLSARYFLQYWSAFCCSCEAVRPLAIALQFILAPAMVSCFKPVTQCNPKCSLFVNNIIC